MKKQTYIRPTTSVLNTVSEGFICQTILSIPIGQGGGPGGGGQAKDGFFEEEDEETFDSSEEKPWGEVSY
ncbi:hypothetical protein J5A66_02765 [Prevotella sp. oral taxon 475]|uniref:hypothetical protein n=1 Tax=Prevotella sp. oral taxon 475 TaxID=712471 RepID=UPI001BA68147|nr:hypothetical protein [Prevotella sp. oral taxon 475]QUB47745.1 hypothetical protein J5A66_02765 [Prevotella sp. oral taxon 475]